MIVSARRQLAARIASGRRGFTLLEVLVVVAILVILAGVAGVYVFGFLDSSKEQIAMDQCGKLENAVKAYMIDPKSQGNPPNDLSILYLGDQQKGIPPMLDGGPSAVTNPWGGGFDYNMVNDGFRNVPQITCVNPQSGHPIYSAKWASVNKSQGR